MKLGRTMGVSGIIFNIQRCSIHDGPGLRTTVFFKGCSLRCFWCHNPEGIRPKPEIKYVPGRCIDCEECRACSQNAHDWVDACHIYQRELCVACGECTASCYSGALEVEGSTVSVDDVMAEVLLDRPFYETSGGGVTLSGGEPVLQPAFALEILRRCKREEIHTAFETAGHCRWETLEELLPFTDLVMMDLKHMHPEKHREATGRTNERILDNARRLAETEAPVIFRIPVVPGVNGTQAEIADITAFVHQLIDQRRNGNWRAAETDIKLELLPFHRLAEDKYRSLGLDYRASGLEPPTKTRMAELTDAAKLI